MDDIRDINLMMNSTIRLADEIPRVVQELILEIPEEEIILHHLNGCHKLLLRCFKVKLHVKLFEEVRNRVGILVLLHLHNP